MTSNHKENVPKSDFQNLLHPYRIRFDLLFFGSCFPLTSARSHPGKEIMITNILLHRWLSISFSLYITNRIYVLSEYINIYILLKINNINYTNIYQYTKVTSSCRHKEALYTFVYFHFHKDA